jgi:hypothetical protein
MALGVGEGIGWTFMCVVFFTGEKLLLRSERRKITSRSMYQTS